MASIHQRRSMDRGYSAHNNREHHEHERNVWPPGGAEDGEEGRVNEVTSSYRERRDVGLQENRYRHGKDRSRHLRYEQEDSMHDRLLPGYSGHQSEPRGLEDRTGGQGGSQQHSNDRYSTMDRYRSRPAPVNTSLSGSDAAMDDYSTSYRNIERQAASRSDSYSSMDYDNRRRDSHSYRESYPEAPRQEREYGQDSGNGTSVSNSRRLLTKCDRWRQPVQPSRYSQGDWRNERTKERDQGYKNGERSCYNEGSYRSNREYDDDRRSVPSGTSSDHQQISDVRPPQGRYRQLSMVRNPHFESNRSVTDRGDFRYNKERSSVNDRFHSNSNHRPPPREFENAVHARGAPKHQSYEDKPYQAFKTTPHTVASLDQTAAADNNAIKKRSFTLEASNTGLPPSKRWRQAENSPHSAARSNNSSDSALKTMKTQVESAVVLTPLSPQKAVTPATSGTRPSPKQDSAKVIEQSSSSRANIPQTLYKSPNAATAVAVKKMEMTNATRKLGIPMRWLKPSSQPKKQPVAPTPSVPAPLISKDVATTITTQDTKQQELVSTRTIMDPSKSESGEAKLPKHTVPSKRVDGDAKPTVLVTDTSEGGSTVSNKESQLLKLGIAVPKEKVPASIVTKPKKMKKFKKADPSPTMEKGGMKPMMKSTTEVATTDFPKMEEVSSVVSPLAERYTETKEDEWNSDAQSESQAESDTESDIEDEETELWAARLLGKAPMDASSFLPSNSYQLIANIGFNDEKTSTGGLDLERLQKKKNREMKKKKASVVRSIKREEYDEEKARKEMEEERRKREEAKPLTAEEIKAILGEEDFSGGNQNSWVRRSVRQPSKALLNSKPVRMLIEMLRLNHPEMKVLKMKKFVNDPNAPSAVLDAALNAMEENTNCEALYIQNFNEGMRDEQVLHLLRILQQPSCKIWCLNIGENYNVGDETWEKFTKGLVHTKITHMYASEHTITGDMKDEIRETIRENRKKHGMHNDPNNIDVIVQCTHCWWNPVNAKVLRPYLKKKGYEHILDDKEAQGLRGSTSAAPTE